MKTNALRTAALGLAVVLLSACSKVKNHGLEDSSSSGAASSSPIHAAETPATEKQAFETIDNSQTDGIKGVISQLGGSMTPLSSSCAQPEGDPSQPYGGNGGTKIGQAGPIGPIDPSQPMHMPPASGVAGNCESVGTAMSDLQQHIDDNCSSLHLSSDVKANLIAELKSGLEALQSLNLTNLSAPDQELVQANVSILQALLDALQA